MNRLYTVDSVVQDRLGLVVPMSEPLECVHGQAIVMGVKRRHDLVELKGNFGLDVY
jgi:hypothetical protein